MNSSNPALKGKLFASNDVQIGIDAKEASRIMTIEGTVRKTMALIFMVLFTGVLGRMFIVANPAVSVSVGPMMLGVSVVTLGLFFLMMWKKEWAPVLAPIYALVEGLLLGVSSIFIDMQAAAQGLGSSLAFMCILGTVSVALSMLALYAFRIIKVGERFRSIIAMGTMGFFVIYLISFAMNMFGFNMPYIHSNGIIGIGFSAFACIWASMKFLTDFSAVEIMSDAKAPKHMEWYMGFAILTTLIWLYIELGRLALKLMSRD